MTIWIVQESGSDLTIKQSDAAYTLVYGGGKPGQCYPCVLIEYEDERTDSLGIESESCNDN